MVDSGACTIFIIIIIIIIIIISCGEEGRRSG